MIRPEQAATQRQRLAVQPFGILGTAHVEPETPELRHHGGRLDIFRSESGSSQLERSLEQRPRAVVDAELAIDPAEEEHHLGLDVWLACQIGFDAGRTAVEQFPRGDLRGVGPRRIRHREEAGEEAAHLVRLGRLPGRDTRLPGRSYQSRDERREHESGRRDANRVTPHELAGTVPHGVPAGGDRATVAVPAHVLHEGSGGRVAARRVLLERLHHDGVEIAPELSAQASRLSPPRLRNRTGPSDDRPATVPGHHRRRPHDIALDDRTLDLGRRPALQLVWPSAGQELIGQRPERVDVRRGRHRLAAHLLWRRVLRRHRPAAEPRQRGERRLIVFVQDLRDPEVEQLDLPVRRDERVRRFQIAVNDEVLVGVLHGVADEGEEIEPRVDVECTRVAVARDRLAGHVLHREERPAVRRHAAVEQAGDVRMMQPREDLPFPQEPLANLIAGVSAADQLERDLLLELAVRPVGQEHMAHAPAADFSDDAVRPDAIARLRLVC